jgi:exosortase/archaeosortase family protein
VRFVSFVPAPTKTEPESLPPKSDFAFGLLLYAATGFVFFPLTRFFFAQTIEQEQLLHAFFILVMAGAWLVYERRVKLRPVWELGRWARALLVASYAVLVVVLLTHWTLLMIPSFCLAIASGAIWAFGERIKRFVGALMGAFALFQGFVLLLPAADWPLRGIAGRFSAWTLDLLGREIQLALAPGAEEPSLILLSNGQPFIVAPECNGFGVIVSSFLLSLLLVLYRRIAVWTKVAVFALAGLIGVVFNTLRITIIVMLAPVVGADRYMLMHEIVGTIVYYAALLGIWFLIQRIPVRRR